MGYGPGPGMMMGGLGFMGILFLLAYIAVVVYAMFLLTRISQSLQSIAASLERMGAARPPQQSQPPSPQQQ